MPAAFFPKQRAENHKYQKTPEDSSKTDAQGKCKMDASSGSDEGGAEGGALLKHRARHYDGSTSEAPVNLARARYPWYHCYLPMRWIIG